MQHQIERNSYQEQSRSEKKIRYKIKKLLTKTLGCLWHIEIFFNDIKPDGQLFLFEITTTIEKKSFQNNKIRPVNQPQALRYVTKMF